MSDLVDTNKIKASFKKGVLAVTLSKRAEARRAERKIIVKAGGSLPFRRS
jgi:HSP20 family protein